MFSDDELEIIAEALATLMDDIESSGEATFAEIRQIERIEDKVERLLEPGE